MAGSHSNLLGLGNGITYLSVPLINYFSYLKKKEIQKRISCFEILVKPKGTEVKLICQAL